MLSLSTPCLLRKSIKNIPFKPCCCSFSSALPRLNNNASGGGGGVPKSHQSFSPVAHSGDYQAITGNALGRDGQTRYEVDFHETLEWVAKLAQRMREDGDKLLGEEESEELSCSIVYITIRA